MRAIEIICDDEMEVIFRIMNRAAAGGITPEELIKRWLVVGLARDTDGNFDKAAMFINNCVRVRRK